MPRSSAATKAARLREIPELLRRRPRTSRDLAEHFSVPQRAIQRDLQHLREEGIAIESKSDGSYALPAPPSSLNAMEAMAVHAAVRLLYHHAPARNQHYLSAMEKLAAMLPEPARSVAFRSGQELERRPGDDRTLELVARAWFEGRVLACDYRSSGGSGRWRKNELEIYLIEVNRDNLAPYAIARERLFHRNVRTWKLSRMRNAQLLDDGYGIPESFDPLQYLSRAWGVMGTSGGPVTTVRLRFTPDVSDRILEGDIVGLSIVGGTKAHGLVTELMVGTDEAGFPREILPWVQSWGPRVEVLAPAALRARWLEDARILLVRYQEEASSGDAGPG